MVRKAYLCWRHWDKKNLKELLTKSLRNSDPESFPELRGLEDFRKAIEIQDKSDLHDPWFVSIVGRNSGKILDWGCGSGRLTRNIAELGFEIDAYDPIIEHKKKVTSNPNINWVDGPKDIKSNRYSVVISNLVLCEIESDEESTEVLNIISKSLESNGKALVTVCHPNSVNVRCSSTIERPPISLNEGKVTYTKIVRSTGRERLEHTRSLEKIRELANSVGLKINQTFNSPGMNIDDCTHTSEYLCIEFIKGGNK
ncbi:class I SAM-dependent methyltransferase, partial [Euryarchaeota archaeon]|nr:class I SAM-dependent methyltransferase [Euryarchaeota archaeon]